MGGRASTPELKHVLTHFSQHSVLEVERLLYRHEGLEKLLAAHEETFIELQTMTEVQGLEKWRLGIPRRGMRVVGWTGVGGQLVSLQVRAP